MRTDTDWHGLSRTDTDWRTRKTGDRQPFSDRWFTWRRKRGTGKWCLSPVFSGISCMSCARIGRTCRTCRTCRTGRSDRSDRADRDNSAKPDSVLTV